MQMWASMRFSVKWNIGLISSVPLPIRKSLWEAYHNVFSLHKDRPRHASCLSQERHSLPFSSASRHSCLLGGNGHTLSASTEGHQQNLVTDAWHHAHPQISNIRCQELAQRTHPHWAMLVSDTWGCRDLQQGMYLECTVQTQKNLCGHKFKLKK